MTDAVKHDSGKLPWSLLPPEGVEPIVAVLAYGAAKYGRHNWREGMDWTRGYDAVQRHLQAWLTGENRDDESGLPHLAHAACTLLFLLAYDDRDIGTDDRFVRGAPTT